MAISSRDISKLYGPLGKGPRLPTPCAEMVGSALCSCYPPLSDAAGRILAHHLYRVARGAPELAAREAIQAIGDDFGLEAYGIEVPAALAESAANGDRLSSWLAHARRLSKDEQRHAAIAAHEVAAAAREEADAADDEADEGGRLRLPKKLRRAAQRAIRKGRADAVAAAKMAARGVADEARGIAWEVADEAKAMAKEETDKVKAKARAKVGEAKAKARAKVDEAKAKARATVDEAKAKALEEAERAQEEIRKRIATLIGEEEAAAAEEADDEGAGAGVMLRVKMSSTKRREEPAKRTLLEALKAAKK